MAKLLKESGASALAKSGSRWRATLAVAGQGSSGFYTEEVLREFGPSALAPGAHAYVGHPTEQNPGRNPKDLIGTYPDGATYEEGVGLVGELDVLPHWADFVEAVAPHTGLSIYMMGEQDADGNVTSLLPDRQNAVDLVSYAGLEGSGLATKLYESAHAASEQNTGVTSAQDQKEGKMDKEILEAVQALASAFTTFVTESKAAATSVVKAEADADAVEKAVESAVDAYSEKVTAINGADLLPSQVESLLADAKLGKDVAPLIESAKKIVTEAKGFVSEQAGFGRVVEGAGATADYSVEGWGN